MGSRKLKTLELHVNIIDRFEKYKLYTCKDVLSITKFELLNVLGVSDKKVEEILHIISSACVSDPENAYEIYKKCNQSTSYLQFSLHILDNVLQGGIPVGCITELSGPPGVGKTQFCFLLSILASLPTSIGGLGGSVIYIDTESTFSAERLKEMAQARFPKFYNSKEKIIDTLQRILVHTATSTKVLKKVLPAMERDIIRKKVKLIILDSVATLMRKEFGVELASIIERNKILLEQAALLKELAKTYEIAVFVTNQITVDIGRENAQNRLSDEEDIDEPNACSSTHSPAQREPKKKKSENYEMEAGHVIPALGVTWAHCVSTRLVAQFMDPIRRQLTIVKSPIAPNAEICYVIRKEGIVLTDDDMHIIEECDPNVQNIQTRYNFGLKFIPQ